MRLGFGSLEDSVAVMPVFPRTLASAAIVLMIVWHSGSHLVTFLWLLC